MLVGTAHISAKSVAEVREVIQREAPSVVAVELDEARHRALTQPEVWKDTKLVDILKEGKGFMLLAQAFLSSYQRRMGEEQGVRPGAELLAAVEEAEARQAELVLADRDIGITLKRAWGRMGLREKGRITWEFMKALTGVSEAIAEEEAAKAAEVAAKAKAAKASETGEASEAVETGPDAVAVKVAPGGETEEADAEGTSEAAAPHAEGKPEKFDVDALLEEDALSMMMDELAQTAPSVSDVLVNERDAYLAGKTRDASLKAGPDARVVAVLGAGHMRGVKAHLEKPDAIPPPAQLETLPKKFPTGKVIAWGLMAVILGGIGLLAYRGFQAGGDFSQLTDFLIQWTLVTGTFSAIGAAVAFAHPASIVVAFLGAPFATIHPLVATGWLSGITEAVVRQPKVRDYEGLSQLTRVRDFWRNGVTRVLLVAAFTNIGAMIGTTYMLPVLGRFLVGG